MWCHNASQSWTVESFLSSEKSEGSPIKHTRTSAIISKFEKVRMALVNMFAA